MMTAKVLIVEDETLIAEDLHRTLSGWGHDILGVVSSGQEAIDIAKQERPDLILMDVRIKGDLNGVQTAIIIQSYYQSSIPVIFITAVPIQLFSVIKSVDPCLYLNKPFSEQELRYCVECKLKSLQQINAVQ
jgi:CheY-like chemotaxis protein